MEIVTKCKTVNEALFYVSRTIEASYSRNVRVNMIEADLFHKEGTALTNYLEKLPEAQGRLAQDIIRSKCVLFCGKMGHGKCSLAVTFYHACPGFESPGIIFYSSKQKKRGCKPKPEKPTFVTAPLWAH